MNIAAVRLMNQMISHPSMEQPAGVATHLAAVQAQDYAGARWALGLRIQGASDADIDRAFNDGEILRTHLLRPTWHFVTPADIRWLLALTAPRVHAVNAGMYRQAGLDSATARRSNDLLAAALEGGRQLTRDELRDELQQAGIAVDAGDNPGLRMIYILMHAELDGVICSGSRRGKQFTYALLAERAPAAVALTPADPLAELARRFFMSRGPATVHDLAKWSGLTIADARLGLEAVKTGLDQVNVDGQVYWFPPGSAAPPVPSPAAWLLSIYDEYISGYKDRAAVGDAAVGARLYAMGTALSYIIVIDGQIVGTCRRTLGKRAVAVELSPFAPLTDEEAAAVVAAANRYGVFLGLPVELNWQMV